MLAHVGSHVGPHRQQDALALVVAGAVLVRLPEVTGNYRAVDGTHDLTEGDVGGRLGKHVTAAHTTLGTDHPRALEGEQDLLQVWLGQAGALGNVADGCGPGTVGVQGQREQGPTGIVTTGRNLHRAPSYGVGTVEAG